MAEKKPFLFHIAETEHFEFTIWAESEAEAMEQGAEIWRRAATTGQWQLPDTETDYSASEIASPFPPHDRGNATCNNS